MLILQSGQNGPIIIRLRYGIVILQFKYTYSLQTLTILYYNLLII